jgi:hypothetical protein
MVKSSVGYWEDRRRRGQVEHRAMEHHETGLDRNDSDGLSRMAFALCVDSHLPEPGLQFSAQTCLVRQHPSSANPAKICEAVFAIGSCFAIPD